MTPSLNTASLTGLPFDDQRSDSAALDSDRVDAQGADTGPKVPFFSDKTSWTMIREAAHDNSEVSRAALSQFAEKYRWSILRFLKKMGAGADAEDLTQEFYLKKIHGGSLLRLADPGKGSFRHYMKQALRNFLRDSMKARASESKLAIWAAHADTRFDIRFDEEWIHSLLESVLTRLKVECAEKGFQARFDLFLGYYLTPGQKDITWRKLAALQGLTEVDASHMSDSVKARFVELLRESVATEVAHQKDIDHELNEWMTVHSISGPGGFAAE